MGILNDPKDKKIRELHTEVSTLRHQLRQVEIERDAYLEQLEGRKDLMWWAMAKSQRQTRELEPMNRRNTTLRFAIKVHEHVLGRRLTKDEWKTARDAVANEAHRDRIDAEPATV